MKTLKSPRRESPTLKKVNKKTELPKIKLPKLKKVTA